MSAAERPSPQITNPPATPKPQPRVSRWAYVLIVIGTLSLFDLVGLGNWGTPLVMIVIGFALLTRHYPWGRTLALVLMSLVLVVIGGWYFIRPASPVGPSTETISLPLTAGSAEIELSPSVGRLEVGPGSSGTLIEGTLGLNRNEQLERQMAMRSGTQVVQLTARQTGANILLFGNLSHDTARWLVTLSPDVQLRLKIKTGVGDSALDLADLKVTDLRFEGGVGRATVRLPKTGIVAADIKSGVGQLNVTVPRGMKARVRVSTGLGAVKVLGDFQRDGEIYTSSGYAGASNRIDLRIEGGVGAVTVEQLGR